MKVKAAFREHYIKSFSLTSVMLKIRNFEPFIIFFLLIWNVMFILLVFQSVIQFHFLFLFQIQFYFCCYRRLKLFSLLIPHRLTVEPYSLNTLELLWVFLPCFAIEKIPKAWSFQSRMSYKHLSLTTSPILDVASFGLQWSTWS